ncbi:hypothetical protein ACIPPQ_10860 [Sphingopyxis sp. LARHCG72]
MTKLRHGNPPRREFNAGSVITVPDTTRPFKPTKAMEAAASQIYRERENRGKARERKEQREAENARWEKTPPSETARIVSALIAVVENTPIPAPTETMKEFRVRCNAWLNDAKRRQALLDARGES